MILSIEQFFKDNWGYFVQAYLLFIVIFVVLRYVFHNKKMVGLLLVYLIIGAVALISMRLNWEISYKVYGYLFLVYPIGALIVAAPDIRKRMDSVHSKQDKANKLLSSSMKTRNEIVDACMYLSSKKIGALITIEKHNSLDQYAQKAIILDSEVSKEMLINIFTPYTPLHDGAVIIRGNRIRCAGAYYVLTEHSDLDKTTGSRHRAGLGISEVSDSLTIICSEETGQISLAIEGMMIKINDKAKLLEYIEMFLR